MTASNATETHPEKAPRARLWTNWLLALSMLPTILGAWLGVQFKFSLVGNAHPALGFMLFLGIAFGFFYGIERTKNRPHNLSSTEPEEHLANSLDPATSSALVEELFACNLFLTSKFLADQFSCDSQSGSRLMRERLRRPKPSIG